MSKVKLSIILGLIIALVMTISVLPGCKTTATTETTVAATTAAETTAAETTAAETVDTKALYTYENLREMAKAGKYDGTPAAGHTLIFDNALKGVDFFTLIQDDVLKQWKLAGGSESDYTLLVNNCDPKQMAADTDIALGKKPDTWIIFYPYPTENAMMGKRAEQAGVYVIAVDIPVQGFPFMGADNLGVGQALGNYIVDYVKNKWGGWDNVDLVVIPNNSVNGEMVNMRMFGAADVLKATFGDSAAYDATGKTQQMEGSKVVIAPTSGNAEPDKAAMTDILSAHPDAKKIIAININDMGASGYQAAAATLGRWNPEDWLLLGTGGDAQGQQLLRDGLISGTVAFFPEKYGEYLIPGALAHAYGNPVPPYLLMEHVVIDMSNIDQYYPKS